MCRLRAMGRLSRPVAAASDRFVAARLRVCRYVRADRAARPLRQTPAPSTRRPPTCCGSPSTPTTCRPRTRSRTPNGSCAASSPPPTSRRSPGGRRYGMTTYKSQAGILSLKRSSLAFKSRLAPVIGSHGLFLTSHSRLVPGVRRDLQVQELNILFQLSCFMLNETVAKWRQIWIMYLGYDIGYKEEARRFEKTPATVGLLIDNNIP